MPQKTLSSQERIENLRFWGYDEAYEYFEATCRFAFEAWKANDYEAETYAVRLAERLAELSYEQSLLWNGDPDNYQFGVWGDHNDYK